MNIAKDIAIIPFLDRRIFFWYPIIATKLLYLLVSKTKVLSIALT